jgi:hypothetical protein
VLQEGWEKVPGVEAEEGEGEGEEHLLLPEQLKSYILPLFPNLDKQFTYHLTHNYNSKKKNVGELAS